MYLLNGYFEALYYSICFAVAAAFRVLLWSPCLVTRFPPSFSNNVSDTYLLLQYIQQCTVYSRRSTATTTGVRRCIVFCAHCRVFAKVSPVFGLYYYWIWKRFRAIPDNVPLEIRIRYTIIRIY